MAKLKITQARSTIGCKKNQIATMEALGLRKIRTEKIHDDTAVYPRNDRKSEASSNC